MEVARWSEIGRARDNLARPGQLAACLDLRGALAACAHVRAIGRSPTFSVSVSFVGKRNYSADEVKMALASAISRKQGWSYQVDDRVADLNIRLFLEHEAGIVGVRLGKTALHNRAYQRVHLPGALKPSVAVALVRLAKVGPGMRVLAPGGRIVLLTDAPETLDLADSYEIQQRQISLFGRRPTIVILTERGRLPPAHL